MTRQATHYPVLVFAVAFVSLSLASAASAWLRRLRSSMNEEQKDDLNLSLATRLKAEFAVRGGRPVQAAHR
jgi:hypothetical protein